MPNSHFQAICVPFDASSAADAALEIALTVVMPAGRVTIVNAIDRAAAIAECATPYGGDASGALEVLEENQRTLLATAGARCAQRGIASTTVPLDGNPASALADFAAAGHFDAVAIGTHARHGLAHLLLGSTAEAVLRASHVPVFVTSEADHTRLVHGIRSIVLAFDASESAQAATQFATMLAGEFDADLAFVHVRERDSDREETALHAMQRSCDASARLHVRCRRIVLDGDVAAAIATAATARAADLIVIGTHGRSGLTLLRLGSVAANVVRSAGVPVLVVPTVAHVRHSVAQAS